MWILLRPVRMPPIDGTVCAGFVRVTVTLRFCTFWFSCREERVLFVAVGYARRELSLPWQDLEVTMTVKRALRGSENRGEATPRQSAPLLLQAQPFSASTIHIIFPNQKDFLKIIPTAQGESNVLTYLCNL